MFLCTFICAMIGDHLHLWSRVTLSACVLCTYVATWAHMNVCLSVCLPDYLSEWGDLPNEHIAKWETQNLCILLVITSPVCLCVSFARITFECWPIVFVHVKCDIAFPAAHSGLVRGLKHQTTSVNVGIDLEIPSKSEQHDFLHKVVLHGWQQLHIRTFRSLSIYHLTSNK